MKKTLSIIIILLICFLILPSALADGGFFIKIHDEDIWRLFDEEQQFCAINYKDGVQHMILTIDTAEKVQGDQAVWIFPVPADPKQVDINILKGFPELFGKDLERLAENSISQAYTLMSISQIYPFPFAYFGTLSPGAFRAGSMEKSLDAEGVTVYERIEKMGLTTELVGALDSQSLENYLTSKDLKLPPEFTLILDEYIGKHYVFVITWISDVHEFRNSQADVEYDYYYRRRTGNTVGVFISFPTPKIYYP
ncbi:DUF2330 domain-containing protein, partial [Candidatus Woesearchaeota archaeon]|nr:DUF2330 domain-containing protein [Candidatus Woesearchaeota archaeon]